MEWILILVVIPFCIGFVGNIVKRAVLGAKPWDEARFSWFQRLYFTTLAWHPVFVALPIGLAFWLARWPQLFGDNPLAYATEALFSSFVAIIAYALLVKTIRRMIGAVGAMVGNGSPDDEP